MKEERDFAGFVLPFAAGVYFTTASRAAYSVHSSTLGITFLSAVALLLAAIWMLSGTCRSKAAVQRTFIILLGLCCGGFIGTGGSIMNIGSSDSPSALEGIAGMMSDAIDRISFRQADSKSIIKALITGDRNGIPSSVTEAFRASGASHILALSGFHLGIIYGIGTWILSWTGGRKSIRISRSLAIISICGIYTIATGAGASIVRAFIFILMRETALITHRSARTSSILLSALVVQLLTDPTSIRSVSFQLSYAAMAGIAYIFPWLDSFWPSEEKGEVKEWPVMRKIWSSAALSISCQLTTGPLAFIYFNSLPGHFLLTNLIAVPITSLLIPASLLVLCLDMAGICPESLVRITEMLVTALSRSLEIISRM